LLFFPAAKKKEKVTMENDKDFKQNTPNHK